MPMCVHVFVGMCMLVSWYVSMQVHCVMYHQLVNPLVCSWEVVLVWLMHYYGQSNQLWNVMMTLITRCVCVCLCACVCVCVYACVSVCMGACVCCLVYGQMWVWVHISVWVCCEWICMFSVPYKNTYSIIVYLLSDNWKCSLYFTQSLISSGEWDRPSGRSWRCSWSWVGEGTTQGAWRRYTNHPTITETSTSIMAHHVCPSLQECPTRQWLPSFTVCP